MVQTMLGFGGNAAFIGGGVEPSIAKYFADKIRRLNLQLLIT